MSYLSINKLKSGKMLLLRTSLEP